MNVGSLLLLELELIYRNRDGRTIWIEKEWDDMYEVR